MSNSRIEEEQKQRLIQPNQLDENVNENDFRPQSSTVKKVINWNEKKQVFELGGEDI